MPAALTTGPDVRPTDPGVRHDLRMVPVAAAAWLAAGAATAERWPLLLAVVGLGIGCAVVGLVRRQVLLQAVALLLVVVALMGVMRVHGLRSGPVAELAEQSASAEVELITKTDLTLSTRPGGPLGWLRAELRLVEARGERHAVRAPVVLIVTGEQTERWRGTVAGSRVRVEARLAAPDPGSDVAAVLRARGDPELVAPPGAGLALVEEVRGGLRQAVEGRSESQRALVPALVVGDTSQMTEQLQQRFAATGLVHLTAVSGANLTLLLAFLLGAARGLGVRGWWLRVVGLLGVGVFIALCRTEPSVLRAAAMGLVALAALGWGGGGERRGLRQLAVAVTVLLLLDPWLSRSVGMALSVLASAGIVWWAAGWAARAPAWVPRWLAESVAVPLAAQLATQPVVTAISGAVSVSGLVANMAAAPFVGPATVLGFAAAGASLLHPLPAALLAWGAAWSAQGIIWVAAAGSAFPGAQWSWPLSPISLLVLTVGCGLLAWAVPRLLSRWWCSLLLVLVMVALLLRPPAQPGWPPPGWFLIACDVGQGDAVLLRTGPGSAVLIDAGADPTLVGSCLAGSGVKEVPVLVLSHFHADHVDGLPGVLEVARVGQVVVPPLASPPEQVARVEGWLAGAGVPVRTLAAGDVWTVGEVSWQTLWPEAAPGSELDPGSTADAGSVGSGLEESGEENDQSLVAVATVAGTRVLLTGDIESTGQAELLAEQGPVRADVLKVPHHGSADQDPAFVLATGARLAVASAGADNPYGHPAPSTVELLAGAGMRVLRTDLSGSLALVREDETVRVTTQR